MAPPLPTRARRRAHPHGHKRRGNAILVGLTLTTMIGFTAISVDFGLIGLTRAQLQVAADAAALAAARELDGTADGLLAADAAATAMAARHSVLGAPLDLSDDALVLGHLDADTNTVITALDVEDVDAIRITTSPRDVNTSFAAVAFGVQSVPVSAIAVAARPAGAGPARSTVCFLPLAVPDCHVSGAAEGENPAPLKLHMGTRTPFTAEEERLAGLLRTTIDGFATQYGDAYAAAMEDILSPYLWPGGVPPSTMAWGRPDLAVDEAYLQASFADRCGQGEVEVGGTLVVDESEHGTALDDLVALLEDRTAVAPDPWLDGVAAPGRDGVTGNLLWNSAIAEHAWGGTMQGPVALVDAGSCDEPTVTGSLEITGIAWGAIYDVRTTGAATNVWLQLDLVNDYEIWGDVDPDGLGNVLGRGRARMTQEGS